MAQAEPDHECRIVPQAEPGSKVIGCLTADDFEVIQLGWGGP